MSENISDIIHGLNCSYLRSLWHCLRFSFRWFFQSSLKRLIQLQPFPSWQDYDSLLQVPSCERSRLFLRLSCSPVCSPVFAITKSTKLLLIVSPLLDLMISATFCSRAHDCHAWRFWISFVQVFIVNWFPLLANRYLHSWWKCLTLCYVMPKVNLAVASTYILLFADK